MKGSEQAAGGYWREAGNVGVLRRYLLPLHHHGPDIRLGPDPGHHDNDTLHGVLRGHRGQGPEHLR